ncbi:hypothetical protein J7J08_08190 [Stenotrophomonas sp. ISL-67]|nr:hypothetical protein [Stenotrophomonas sp. ISL-67]MBT2767617.1 hypothetical protein [Stenotrophomonas sp. ISL-67]
MATLIATVVALCLLAAVGVLLVWALSALCRFLAALLPDPSEKASP